MATARAVKPAEENRSSLVYSITDSWTTVKMHDIFYNGHELLPLLRLRSRKKEKKEAKRKKKERK